MINQLNNLAVVMICDDDHINARPELLDCVPMDDATRLYVLQSMCTADKRDASVMRALVERDVLSLVVVLPAVLQDAEVDIVDDDVR